MDSFEIMLKPFLACLILGGIHAYLGLHVIERGVIFVDLALAQVAAFGATVGFLLGFGLHSTACYLISLGFSLLGAALLAATRLKNQIVPQESIIGVIYAVFAAAAILVLSKAPEGGEELKNLMVGHLLFIDWSEIIKIFVIYSIIGILHYRFRKQLFATSFVTQKSEQPSFNLKLWDFLFYATFAVVVTSSVEVAGVLLVFSFLIVPAICGVLLGDSIKSRLLYGWLVGGVTSILGIYGSYYLDFPTGATIVVAFGFSLLFCGLYRGIKQLSAS